jgi:tetratricopeptide (TPR) repeat protein
LAWEGFLSCYRVGERRTREVEAVRDHTVSLLREAIELEPHNATVLALAGYTYSFVLRNPVVGGELSERSLVLDANNVMGCVALGIAKTYQGDFRGGHHWLARARAVSGEGPYRHLVDLYAGIASSVVGEFDRGAAILETVSALTPDFAPPLRYLIPAYLRLGNPEGAANALQRLRGLEPDLELRDLLEPDYPVPAMQRAGLLDPKKLPRLL